MQITTGEEIETYPAALASGKHLAVLSAAAARPQSVAVVDQTIRRQRTPKRDFPGAGASFPAAAHVVPENVTLTADDGVKFNNQLFVPKGSVARAKSGRPWCSCTAGRRGRCCSATTTCTSTTWRTPSISGSPARDMSSVGELSARDRLWPPFRTAPNTGAPATQSIETSSPPASICRPARTSTAIASASGALSYGGVLTAQALARNSDIFKVGVDLAGVHLWGGSVEPDNVSFQSSAISAIGNWKSPVLLLHGDDDRNVAFAQTIGLVQLLRAHNVDHELIVFPDDVHDSLLYKRWIYTFDRASEFIGRYIGQRRTTTTQ